MQLSTITAPIPRSDCRQHTLDYLDSNIDTLKTLRAMLKTIEAEQKHQTRTEYNQGYTDGVLRVCETVQAVLKQGKKAA